MPHTRRNVLAGIGSTVAVAGGTGIVLADPPGDRGRGRDDDDEEDGGDEAAVRVAHASPDAPAVDVYVDGSRVIESLGFRDVTDYLELSDGEYGVQVTAAGDPDTVVFDQTVELAGEDYTAVALGEVASDDTEFGVEVFEDENGRVFDGNARVRVVHASPDAPAVDVTVNDGSAMLFDGVEFGESGGYVEVPAGEYAVEVRPDTEDDDGSVVFETILPLTAGSIYTVFAVGYLSPDDESSDEEFGLVPTIDKTAPPRGDEDEDEEEDDEEDDEDEREEEDDEDDEEESERDDDDEEEQDEDDEEEEEEDEEEEDDD
ncbi:DUF4397 domain-containing protein [Salinirubrum litoreum]|uniref:DUF4397 domain-containing protein n=1 Tax=Salinirubrum litoreum TaxID=1126234 RepID=UPI001D064358|nr:DUF4397 domain-containing protein [Salinirubrum litoreum]